VQRRASHVAGIDRISQWPAVIDQRVQCRWTEQLGEPIEDELTAAKPDEGMLSDPMVRGTALSFTALAVRMLAARMEAGRRRAVVNFVAAGLSAGSAFETGVASGISFMAVPPLAGSGFGAPKAVLAFGLGSVFLAATYYNAMEAQYYLGLALDDWALAETE
jgi:hypothetical protein